MDRETTRSILLAAAAKIAAKESRRELLAGGKSHAVIVRMSGNVDGEVFRGEKFEGSLTVDLDTTQSASVAAPPAEVVAYFLGALSATARRRILADLPDEFLAAGGMPAIDDEHLAEAKTLLERLRSRVDQPRTGAVKWSFAK
jgi:hypothetical protein